MTWGKAITLIVVLVAVMGLGLWLAKSMNDETPSSAPLTAEAPAVTDAPARTAAPRAGTTTPAVEPSRRIDATDPELLRRLKPLLNQGTDMDLAAAGFSDGERFAEVVHAARNTSIPFVVLKDRVLEKGKSLKDAIGELKPDLDASLEARRAATDARVTIASIGS